jgi:hypothetical protein
MKEADEEEGNKGPSFTRNRVLLTKIHMKLFHKYSDIEGIPGK